nr:FecR family protein [Acidobacteriota bacterium]
MTTVTRSTASPTRHAALGRVLSALLLAGLALVAPAAAQYDNAPPAGRYETGRDAQPYDNGQPAYSYGRDDRNDRNDRGQPPAPYDNFQAGQAAGPYDNTEPAVQPDNAPTGSANGYSYLRMVQGSATLTQAGSNSSGPGEVNQPILIGDSLSVPGRGRAEVVLADHNILRIDGGSEVVFDHLAGSPDGGDRTTVVHLVQGHLQLVVDGQAVGDQLPEIDTPNAAVYIQDPGTYRITSDGGSWSELVVRRGTAQMVTASDRVAVGAGQEATASGERRASLETGQAAGFDSLERWGRQLDDEVQSADLGNVDPSLRYQSASLSRYGHWLDVEGQSYWQPTAVGAEWSPYLEGRWDYTPSGISWVSSEPWGWVPYHYGSWSYLASYGWAWQPGYVFSPAWVYWYWGASHVGWCPIGYYTSFYGPRFGFGFGFHFGVYGWAGGGWGGFNHWNFVDIDHFGHHHLNRFAVPADRLEHRLGRPLGNGIITTDTRRLTPGTWHNPAAVTRVLSNGRPNLPNVTPFVNRQTHLPAPVVHGVSARGPGERMA